jgi:hypothetical protein
VDALPRFTQGAERHLLGHPRQRTVIHAGVDEDALVFGGPDRLAHDERHLVVRHDPAELARQFVLLVLRAEVTMPTTTRHATTTQRPMREPP